MKKLNLATLIVVFEITLSQSSNASAFENLGKDCKDYKAYARAVFAVAEAQDNLDEPSMEELKKLHPILKDLEDTEVRAWIYVSLINLRVINKRASPKALMTESYESCIDGGGFCLLYGKGCPND